MADLGLTMEAQATLKRAFDDAKQWKRRRMRLRGSGPEGWEEAKTQFEKNQSDIRLEYDQNLNPEEVSKELENQLRFVMQVVQQRATSTFAKRAPILPVIPSFGLRFSHGILCCSTSASGRARFLTKRSSRWTRMRS